MYQIPTLQKSFYYFKVVFLLETLENPKHAKIQKRVSRFLFFSVVVVLQAYYYSAFASENVSIKIQSAFLAEILTIATILIILCIIFKDTFEDCLKWCQWLDERFFDSENFRRCKESSTKILAIFVCGLPIVTSTFATLQSITLGILAGKFKICVPLTLPYESPVCVLFVAIAITATAFLVAMSLGLMYGIMFVLLQYFKSILVHLQEIAQLLTPTTSKKVFSDTVKEFVELHCEMIQYQNVLEKFAYVPTLCFEFYTYGLFLIIWIMWFFFRDGIFVAIGCSGNIVPYYILCFLNEKLADAYDDLLFTLYDLKWYEMTPTQRRTILQLMVFVGRQKLLRSGPFHVFSFESFADMLNRVYSYGTVLNILAQ